MKQTRRGRPSNKSKSEVQALDAEVSDETFWSLVKKSQIRPSEEPSFDRVDLFSGDDGRGQMTSDDKDDEAFIDGLIRMPSFTMLDAEMNVRVDGSAANFGTPSPAESSGAPVRQAYNSIFESSQATGQMSRARATSQSDSAADGISVHMCPAWQHVPRRQSMWQRASHTRMHGTRRREDGAGSVNAIVQDIRRA